MFKTIGVFGKYQDTSVEEPLKKLTAHLESKGIEVKLGQTTADEIVSHLPQKQISDDLAQDIDLAIVIGGDGTLLHVARKMAESDIPVTGINLGRLGFLTDIALANMIQEVDEILAGKYTTEQRMMLQCEVLKENQPVYQKIALNDVVIGKHALEKLISWQVHVDDQFVTAARSDGVIFINTNWLNSLCLVGWRCHHAP